METPLPYMEEMEDALIHIDIKDRGYGDSLSPNASLRLRAFWLLARLFYEVRFYPLAKMAQLKPFNALYGTGAPKALCTIQDPAAFYAKLICDRDRGIS